MLMNDGKYMFEKCATSGSKWRTEPYLIVLSSDSTLKLKCYFLVLGFFFFSFFYNLYVLGQM